MGGINTGRWFISGIVAGVIIAAVDFVVSGMILAPRWEEVMSGLGLPPMAAGAGTTILFVGIDLVVGLAALWIYVGIRPRFGPGVMTAAYAGLVTWLLFIVLPDVFMMSVGVFPAGLLTIVIVVGVVQVVVATVVGAYIYKEDSA